MGKEGMAEETIVGDTKREAVVVSSVGESTMSCISSFGRKGIPTIVISPKPDAIHFHSRYCSEAVVVPSPDDDLIKYKNALLSLARRDNVRTIIPMQEADVYVLSNFWTEFEGHLEQLWPSFDKLRISQDRVRLVRAAEAAGVPTPDTQLLTDVDDWNRELIVKSRYSVITDEYVRSVPPEYFHEPSSTKYLEPGNEPNFEAIRAEMDHVPIVQQYVPGTEYAFWALYDRGNPVATCHKHQLRGDSYAGGVSTYRETTYDPELEEIGRALLDHLDWHGLAAVQFIKDAVTGEFKLLEINPRVWFSISCAIQAGLDFPHYYWRLAGDEPVPADPGYAPGIGTHDLSGEIEYLRSIVADEFPAYVERPSLERAIWDVVSALYAQPNFAYVNIDDPAPLVVGLSKNALRMPRQLGRSVADHLTQTDAERPRT